MQFCNLFFHLKNTLLNLRSFLKTEVDMHTFKTPSKLLPRKTEHQDHAIIQISHTYRPCSFISPNSYYKKFPKQWNFNVGFSGCYRG